MAKTDLELQQDLIDGLSMAASMKRGRAIVAEAEFRPKDAAALSAAAQALEEEVEILMKEGEGK